MSTAGKIALVGGGLLVGYVVVKSLTTKVTTSRTPTGNQSTAAFLGSLFGAGIGSIFASAGSNTNTVASPGLVPNDAASTQSFNNISTSDLNTLAAQDAAAGVEGPF